jgi:hypothetical protein
MFSICPADVPILIVISGYSKTVREVLAREELPKSAKVYLLIEPQANHLATRLMKSELKYSGGQGLRYSRRRLAAGTLETLVGMISRNQRVIVLLGVECFDSFGRVVHPRGLAAPLERLLHELTKDHVKHIIVGVAEGYKRVSGELVDSEFFADHMDGVDVYPVDLVDLIVTEDKPGPEDWEPDFRKKLGLSRRRRNSLSLRNQRGVIRPAG